MNGLPQSGPQPAWSVALDKMRDEHGNQRVGVVELTSGEAIALVNHYLKRNEEYDALLATSVRLRDRAKSAEKALREADTLLIEADSEITHMIARKRWATSGDGASFLAHKIRKAYESRRRVAALPGTASE